MIDWNIQARARACQVCGGAFAHQDPYHTVLHEEKSAYARQDMCEACWSKSPADTWMTRPGFISHWQGIYEVAPPPTELIRRETAEGLLRKLVQRQDPRYLAATFILAVMLERKRLLRVKEQLQRDGQRVILYEQPKSGDLFAIMDPQLELDQLEAVQRDVAHLLEHGLDPEQPDAGPEAVGELPEDDLGENRSASEPMAAPNPAESSCG